MNPTRASKVQDLEDASQARMRLKQLPPDQRVMEQLNSLQLFVSHLMRTAYGQDDLQRRVEMFGECTQNRGESARDFYARLRCWLDKDIEDKKTLRASDEDDLSDAR